MRIPLLPHWNLQPRHQIRNTPESPQNSPYRAKTRNQYNFIDTSENAIQPQIRPHTEIAANRPRTRGNHRTESDPDQHEKHDRRHDRRRQARKNQSDGIRTFRAADTRKIAF